MRVVKNYRNKNTQTNKIIISTMSKEKKKKSLFELEMVMKWVKSWGNPKAYAKKLKKISMRYI